MKRGQRATHRVLYRWTDTGITGKVACLDQWSAEHRADDIRRQGELQGREVEVTIEVVS